jgi:hypothetical protein
MAQTKKRRRRKHRGTQGGSIDNTRRSRPRSRAEARAQARSQMSKSRAKSTRAPAQRQPRKPSWSGAVNRAAIGALIFLGILLLLFKQPPGTSIALAGLMFAMYIPMGHAIDSFFYNRRRRSEQRARASGRS